jgi:hypothetical protein
MQGGGNILQITAVSTSLRVEQSKAKALFTVSNLSGQRLQVRTRVERDAPGAEELVQSRGADRARHAGRANGTICRLTRCSGGHWCRSRLGARPRQRCASGHEFRRPYEVAGGFGTWNYDYPGGAPTSEGGEHTHAISRGEKETRPKNAAVVWIIKT